MGGTDTSIANEEFWSSVGYWILVAGLVGDIVVLVVPKHRERLEKVFAALFTIVIILGVAIEHRADAAISVLVSQEQHDADARIQEAKRSVASLEGDNLKLSGDLETEKAKVAGLQTAASDAKAAQQKVEVELAKQQGLAEQLKAQNLATDQSLEDERNTRLELEKSLAPRVLAYIFNKGVENIAPLRAYAGMRVILEYIPDMEAARAIGSIAPVIGQAGWKVVSSAQRTDLVDGVTIESYAPMDPHPNSEEMRAQSEALQKGLSAARVLKDLLVSSGWENVNAWLATNPKEPLVPDTIRIRVGFKPNPYFEPPEFKAARERARQMEEEMKNRLNKSPRQTRVPSRGSRAILPRMSWQQQPSNAFNVLDLDELRERLRKMSDNDLIKFGKDCAFLCSPKQNFGKPPDKVWSVITYAIFRTFEEGQVWLVEQRV